MQWYETLGKEKIQQVTEVTTHESISINQGLYIIKKIRDITKQHARCGKFKKII